MNTGALGPRTVISMDGEARSRVEKALRWAWRSALVILVLLLVALAVLVAVGDLYKPGDSFGYALGLVGGLLMATQLAYAARKRIPALARFGLMDHWFRYHMIVGISAPILILFHSTFRPGSTNGSIALYAMLLVACSGAVGRFFYRRINRGLHGRQMTLGELTQELRASLESVGSVFALRPDIEPRLMGFYRDAFATELGLPERAWRFMTIRLRARRLGYEIRTDAKKALRRRRRTDKQVSKAELILNYKLARKQVNNFLEAVVQAAQYRTWEKLFSLWHIIHIPFLYLLLFSGIVHVIAVHMY
jgi:hypothetical protein